MSAEPIDSPPLSHQRSFASLRMDERAEHVVEILLRLIGEDPQRDGLRDTPARVVKALLEMTTGYGQSPAEILSTTFAEHSDELIILRGIDFFSTCEHHLLPFHGVAHVGYLPGKVVGISKLARLVHCFARRLQIQERMTQQIAEAVETHLGARGVAVVVTAHHLCMGRSRCETSDQPADHLRDARHASQRRRDARGVPAPLRQHGLIVGRIERDRSRCNRT